MIRWISGTSELIISLASILGLSLIGKSPQQFCIEQFIILSPHVISYACSIALHKDYIHLKCLHSKYLYYVLFMFLNIITAILLFISLIGLFMAIKNSIITFGNGYMIISDYIMVLSKPEIPVSVILAFDVISMVMIDTYAIGIAVNSNRNRR